MLVLVIISTLARSTAITVVSVPTVVATPRTARANLAISRTRLHSVPHSPPRREPSPRSIRSPSAEAQDHHRSNVEPGVLDHDRERHHVDPTRADAPFTGGLADKTPTTPNEVRYLVPPQRETSPSYWRPQVASSLRNAIRTNACDAEGRLREEYARCRRIPIIPRTLGASASSITFQRVVQTLCSYRTASGCTRSREDVFVVVGTTQTKTAHTT